MPTGAEGAARVEEDQAWCWAYKSQAAAEAKLNQGMYKSEQT